MPQVVIQRRQAHAAALAELLPRAVSTIRVIPEELFDLLPSCSFHVAIVSDTRLATQQGLVGRIQSVFEIVERYSKRLGVPVAPHDLRRTFAKLAHRGHAPLEQIQLSLGQCVGADDGTVFVVGAGSGGCAV